MKHNEKAVEDMARLLFKANPEIDSEQKFEEWRDEFDPMAVAVLDKLVPPGYDDIPKNITMTTQQDFGGRSLDLLDGTANLTRQPRTTSGEEVTQ